MYVRKYKVNREIVHYVKFEKDTLLLESLTEYAIQNKIKIERGFFCFSFARFFVFMEAENCSFFKKKKKKLLICDMCSKYLLVIFFKNNYY